MKVFQIPAELVTYGKMKDKGFKITFETGELSPEQVANIHYGSTKVGWLAFAPDPFATAEMDEIEKTKVEFKDGSKPPSQRMRAVLYRLFEQNDEGYKAFSDYYNAKMEQFIIHLKGEAAVTHLDLFAGIGGFSIAAQWMGWTTVVQVEWDEWCQKVLAKNFPDALRFGDIVEFNKMLENGENITNTESRKSGEQKTGDGWQNISRRSEKTHGQLSIGRIDILTGGFPCQPFSHAGKRKGTDDSRYLWPAMLETIRRVKPAYVVGENVAGLVSMENGKTLDRILSDLEDEGYTTEQFIIPACAIGAWHRRDRIWIIGINTNHHTIGCDNGKCTIKEGSKRGGESFDRYEGLDKDVSDGNGKYGKELLRRDKLGKATGERTFRRSDAPTGRKWKSKSELGGMVARLSVGMDGYWDREPEGIPRVATGVKDRVNRLKGLGNAIVPQVAYQIFKAIEEYEELHRHLL